MLNLLYIDPKEREFIEDSRMKTPLKFNFNIYIEDTDIRVYPYIAEKVKSLINNINWFSEKIYLPNIILEDDIILQEKNHHFKYLTLDTIVYQISSVKLEGIDVFTNRYNLTVNVEKTSQKKKLSNQVELAFSFGLN